MVYTGRVEITGKGRVDFVMGGDRNTGMGIEDDKKQKKKQV
jgi:hypothetical protein